MIRDSGTAVSAALRAVAIERKGLLALEEALATPGEASLGRALQRAVETLLDIVCKREFRPPIRFRASRQRTRKPAAVKRFQVTSPDAPAPMTTTSTVAVTFSVSQDNLA